MKKLISLLCIFVLTNKLIASESQLEKYRRRLELVIAATPENSTTNLAFKIFFLRQLHKNYPTLPRYEKKRKEIGSHIGALNVQLINSNVREIKKAKEEANKRGEIETTSPHSIQLRNLMSDPTSPSSKTSADEDSWIVINIK